tara:strand:+ start:306 stop:530 length:225 start_codon:yes stop_codon:yes gene_type:complete
MKPNPRVKPTTLKAEISIRLEHDPHNIETIELDIEKNKEYDTGTELLKMFQGIVTDLVTNESDEAILKITLFRG